MKGRILTGDRPTGKLHLGHYIGSLQNRVKLQEEYEQFIMIADVQALTDNFDNPGKITNNIIEVTKDYISVGIDPEKTNIFIQSQINEIAELTLYYMNLVNLGRLERNPTIKNEIETKNFGHNIPVGFLCYPINQAADISIFKANLVPVGYDQLPMIEQTNEIVRKFNRIYDSSILKECKAYISDHSKLIGIDGKAKASKSLNNAIFLSDDVEDIRKKVMSMYTDPNHIKISDPGNVENNVVFKYLDAFCEDQEKVIEMKQHYEKGGLGDVTIKKFLNDVLQNLLEPIRDRRNNIKDEDVIEILRNGTYNAKSVASNTMKEVLDVLGVNYFFK